MKRSINRAEPGPLGPCAGRPLPNLRHADTIVEILELLSALANIADDIEGD